MNGIRRFARVEARLEPFRWGWAEEHGDAIAAHWRMRRANRPALFNGRALMTFAVERGADTAVARFFETDYANLLAWIDGGFPGEPVWNGFAMGALRTADGGFVLGRMGAHTANAGRLYFPCGTPDRSDVRPDGTVDLAGSIRREIAEETGLSEADYRVDPDWILVESRGLLAFMRIVRLAMDADEAKARIGRFIAAEPRSELQAVEIVSGPDGICEDTMPGVVPLFLRDAFAAG